jgi:capsular polysaccharide biosynthesis protein
VDFWDLTKLLARRWMVAVPMLILSVALTWLTFTHVKPNYVATAYVQLVPPVLGATNPGQATPEQRNPWLGLGLQTIGNAANVTVLDHTFIQQLDAAGFSDTFTSTMDPSTPLITIEVVGHTKQQARETADLIVKRFTEGVVTLQSALGVSPADSINARRLDLGTNVEKSDSKVKRALVAVAGVGLLMTAAVTVGVDAWLRRRRVRAEAAKPEVPTKPSTPKQAFDARRPRPDMAGIRMTTNPTHRSNEDGATMPIPTTKGPVVVTTGGTNGGPPTVTLEYQAADGPPPVKQPGVNGTDPDPAPAPAMESADATLVLPLFLPGRDPRRPGAGGDDRPRR